MRLGYFPGCSLRATAKELDLSLRAIAGPLGIELVEIDDWACCGASAVHATNHLLSIALPARTLALAEEQQHDRLLAPCAACYSRLATARHELSRDEALAARVRGILQRPLDNEVAVLSLVELLRDLAPVIRAKSVTPLSGLRVACYYGCLLLRPPEVTAFDDAEAPTSMEQVVRATGAEPVAWSMRSECCGAGLSVARTGSVVRLGRAILQDASRSHADVVVVSCPMCHSNLDMRQRAMRLEAPLPILFLTELVGLALGLAPKVLGIPSHFVNAMPVVERLRAHAGGGESA